MVANRARTDSQLIMNIYADIQVLKAKVSQHDKLLYTILTMLVALFLKLLFYP